MTDCFENPVHATNSSPVVGPEYLKTGVISTKNGRDLYHLQFLREIAHDLGFAEAGLMQTHGRRFECPGMFRIFAYICQCQ